MSTDAETLYGLLPAIYRLRDAEQGEPLKALLSIVAAQVAVLEADLEQLYDDQFIETCADWVVPYIGDLIGHRPLHGVSTRVSSPRAAVANTIAYRRRKGTAAMLEQLARDVTGWDAKVSEYFHLLAATQYLRHLRPDTLAVPDLRRWEPLERVGMPFDSLPHTVDVRRIASQRGRYNIPNVGVVLWRLRSYRRTAVPAFRVDAQRYLFHPLGINTPLLTAPQSLDDLAQRVEPRHVPMPISRRVLDAYLDDYYGPGKSLMLYVDGKAVPDPAVPTQRPADRLIVCDLRDVYDAQGHVTGWAHTPPPNKIALDPVLGRLAFPTPPSQVQVTYHYGFSADIGGGEYERSVSHDVPPAAVIAPGSLQSALNGLHGQGVVEIRDNGRYAETLSLQAAAQQRLELRAADGYRPLLLLAGELLISGAAGSDVTLDGLLISGGPVRVQGHIQSLRLRHCTLVPGLALLPDGAPAQPTAPSLIVESPTTQVEIDSCILGGLRVIDSATVQITNSMVDATTESGVAYAAVDGQAVGGALSLAQSTVIGQVAATVMPLVSQTIFLASLPSGAPPGPPVRVTRRQEGCVRFSYVPLNAQVPQRYRCQPVSPETADRLRPQFTSRRYGEAGYGQLSLHTASEIRQGAEDGAEMGVFHDLQQPQRETNLRVRLAEYLRFGVEAGIFYAS